MDSGQILSWVVGAVGLTGFYFSGKKVWWSWYINLGCQALWFAYAIVTSTPAFAATALVYTVMFGRNAHLWTKEELSKRKAANGNISKNRNGRRKAIYGRQGKWREPRAVGEQQWSIDGDPSRVAPAGKHRKPNDKSPRVRLHSNV